nr:hypothetical protein [uncultured Draconibacterium sp.]
MAKTDNSLEKIINNPIPSGVIELMELATYLSSNKEYVYTQTYLGDSAQDFNRFKMNTFELKKKTLETFSKFQTKLKELLLPTSYKYEIQINKVISVTSADPEQLKIIKANENQLLTFLNQKDYFKHYLCLKFSYKTNAQLFEILDIEFPYNIEHTVDIMKEADIDQAIHYFTNILKLDLCQK